MVKQKYQLQKQFFAAAFKIGTLKNFTIFTRPATPLYREHPRWIPLQLAHPAILLLFKFGKFVLVKIDLLCFVKVTLFNYDDVISIVQTIPGSIGASCKTL